MMVPHSIITVSLATAILPRLSARAAERRPRRAGPVADLDAAHRAGRGRAVRAAAAADRPRRRQRDLGPRRRPRRLSSLYTLVAGPLRARPGVLHRPLPDAARLLRPRAHPHGLLHPVRGRRRPTSRPPWCWSRSTDAVHTSPGAGASPTPRRTPSARSCRTPCCAACSAGSRPAGWSGSWCGWRCAVGASRPRPRTLVACGLHGLAERPALAGRGRPGASRSPLVDVVVFVVAGADAAAAAR